MSRRDLTAEVAEDKFDVEREARLRGLQPYQLRAMQAVPDRLMADIVADARRGISQSASMIPDRQRREMEKPTGSVNGWIESQPLAPPDTRWVDAQLDAQDRRDKAAAVRVRIENALAQDLMNKGDDE